MERFVQRQALVARDMAKRMVSLLIWRLCLRSLMQTISFASKDPLVDQACLTAGGPGYRYHTQAAQNLAI